MLLLFSVFLFWDKVWFCRPGWSAVVQSRLVAPSASQAQAIPNRSLPSSWGHKYTTPGPANVCSVCRHGEGGRCLPMLPRLVSNSWAQVICPPWSPKVLGLQGWATVLGAKKLSCIPCSFPPFSFLFFLEFLLILYGASRLVPTLVFLYFSPSISLLLLEYLLEIILESKPSFEVFFLFTFFNFKNFLILFPLLSFL